MNRAPLVLLLLAAGCTFPAYTEEQPVAVASCHDGLLNHSELDVDCGPACNATCKMGQVCTKDGECQSGSCQAGKCAAPSTPDTPSIPSCSNGTRDGSETDLDCGGTDGCPPCATGERCESDYDCNLARCNAGICQEQTCFDGIQNQDETDIDCGGATGCSRCDTKQHCSSAADCLDSQCSQGLCRAQGCDDGLQNGDETDMDCGGSCVPCADLERCRTQDDCLSLSCSEAGVCQAASCDDGILNGNEPSLDCGASCGEDDDRCQMTQRCVIDGDCKSGKCDGMRCVPESATGEELSRAGWIASASNTFDQSVAGKALDGDGSTFWESGTGQLPGMWFQVDMREPRPFFAVELQCTSNGDYPRKVRMLISEDGQSFTAATDIVNGEKNQRFDFASARIARYVRFELQSDTDGIWWRIDELRVRQ